MILFPAVDIRDGRAVRLTQGDYDREQIYNDDPLAAARDWVEQGATHLHVVDLDGALHGERRNVEHLRRISELAVYEKKPDQPQGAACSSCPHSRRQPPGTHSRQIGRVSDD